MDLESCKRLGIDGWPSAQKENHISCGQAGQD